MRLREAVASALHLLVVLSYWALGCFLGLMAVRIDWRMRAADWLERQPGLLGWAAGAFVAVGFLFLLGFYGVGRGRFLRVGMGSHPVAVDAKVIERAIEECFRRQFPDEVRGADVAVSQDRLEIAVDVASDEVLERVERELGALLKGRFGYEKGFTLSARLK